MLNQVESFVTVIDSPSAMLPMGCHFAAEYDGFWKRQRSE